MKREIYEKPEIEMIEFETEDVMTDPSTTIPWDEYELPFIPNKP